MLPGQPVSGFQQSAWCAPRELPPRAVVLLLLANGWSYRAIGEAVFASHTPLRAVKKDFTAGGVARVLCTEERPFTVAYWLIVVVRGLLQFTPRDFGFFRSRWTCAVLALLLREGEGVRHSAETRTVLSQLSDERARRREGVRLSAETVRRGLHRMEFVWRRPRPVVGPKDPQYEAKLRQLQQLVAKSHDDETVVFQEVEVQLNPKIGCQWMPRGEQAEVVAPGNNEKRHLAGCLHWRTGTLLPWSPGTRRDRQLFLTHLDDLRCRPGQFGNIHVICENAKFHRCRAVGEYLARWQGRIELH